MQLSSSKPVSPAAYSCAVIIPFHSAVPNEHEQRSLFNTLQTLRKWDTYVLLPYGVDTSVWERLTADAAHVQIRSLEPGWLGSVDKYNVMALSSRFYEVFRNYEYILMCHLDAWVFQDTLNYWMSLGYDYIGAPLFLPDPPGGVDSLWQLAAPAGGNGGLCLRRVAKMAQLTSAPIIRPNYLLFLQGIAFLRRNHRRDLLRIYLNICRWMWRDHREFQEKHRPNEDVLLSLLWAIFDRSMRVAPPKVSRHFALEVNAREVFTTHLQLRVPFGVHGLFKHVSEDDLSTLMARQEQSACDPMPDVPNQGMTARPEPLVTVITPIRNIIRANRVGTLQQCIESVRSQSYPFIEHLIIDGASDDGTLDMLRPYADRGQVTIHSESDDGAWDAMRRGARIAKGEFVNIMNSDDYFADTNAIRIAIDLMKRDGADWFFSSAQIIRLDGSSYSFPTSAYGVFRCMGIVHQTMFVRKKILNAIDPFGVTHRTKENYLMMLLMLNGIRYASSPAALVHYREGGFSTHDYGGENLDSTRRDFADYFYALAGKRWGLSYANCIGMFCLEAFDYESLRHNIRVGRKIRLAGLRRWYFQELLRHAWRRCVRKLLRR